MDDEQWQQDPVELASLVEDLRFDRVKPVGSLDLRSDLVHAVDLGVFRGLWLRQRDADLSRCFAASAGAAP
jgi:hypothetical protein